MRLINADDKLLRAELFTYINTGMETAINAIDKAPTIDAVEVVRCKDCRYREFEGEITHFYWCRINERPVDDADYCAWGEESEVEE